jgi:uncharacterized membrane protein
MVEKNTENKEKNGVSPTSWFDKFAITLPKGIIIFLFVYALLPFVSPIAFKLGNDSIGIGIQNIYRIFCHQRVERSMFLFAEDGLVKYYTIDELKEIGYLNRQTKPSLYGDGWELYQYPYWGNEKIGYKVAYCIRDVGLYLGLAFTCLFLYLYITRTGKNIWLKWYWILLLCIPMMFDGVFQTFVEILGKHMMGGLYDPSWVVPYIANIPKRWISGLLFGIGFGFIVMPNLIDSAESIKSETTEKV